MNIWITLCMLAVASASPLGGVKRSFGVHQYNIPSIYSYNEPVAYIPSSSQYVTSQQFVPTSSRLISSSPNFVPSPQYGQLRQQYTLTSPQFVSSPQYVSVSPDNLPTQYVSYSPEFVSTSPQYVSTSPNFASSAPQYISSSPALVPSNSIRPSRQYYYGPATPLTNQWSSASSSASASTATASATSYSVQSPYAYNTNSYRVSQPTQTKYTRWDPVRNIWC